MEEAKSLIDKIEECIQDQQNDDPTIAESSYEYTNQVLNVILSYLQQQY